MRAGKTPDFKLFKDGKLCGYCELKSPRDDWVFDFPNDLATDEPRVEVHKDPAAHNLARNIGKAAAQFAAVNPQRALPNILVLVSHARLRGPTDLHMAIAGVPMPDGKAAFLLLDENQKDQKKVWEKQKGLWDAARRVDLFMWIDAKKWTCQHISVDGAPHQKTALDLLGLRGEAAS